MGGFDTYDVGKEGKQVQIVISCEKKEKKKCKVVRNTLRSALASRLAKSFESLDKDGNKMVGDEELYASLERKDLSQEEAAGFVTAVDSYDRSLGMPRQIRYWSDDVEGFDDAKGRRESHGFTLADLYAYERFQFSTKMRSSGGEEVSEGDIFREYENTFAYNKKMIASIEDYFLGWRCAEVDPTQTYLWGTAMDQFEPDRFPSMKGNIHPFHLKQNLAGNCFFLATLASFFQHGQWSIEVHPNGYRVSTQGQPSPIAIPNLTNAEAAVFSSVRDDSWSNPVYRGAWPAIFEKAYAQFVRGNVHQLGYRGDKEKVATDWQASQYQPSGPKGFEWAYAFFTGNSLKSYCTVHDNDGGIPRPRIQSTYSGQGWKNAVDSKIQTESQLITYLHGKITQALDGQKIVTASTPSHGGFRTREGGPEHVGGHAYSIFKVEEAEDPERSTVHFFNPHGFTDQIPFAGMIDAFDWIVIGD